MAKAKEFSDEEKIKLCEFVINLIAEESLSLRKAVKKVGFEFRLPDLSRNTVEKWFEKFELKDQYARAREYRAENIFEEIIDIVDREDDDVRIDEEGNEHTNHDVIQRDRLRVDARKWMLGKMQPKKYGDKQEVDVTTNGKDINTNPLVFVSANDLPQEQLDSLIKAQIGDSEIDADSSNDTSS